MNAVAIFNEWNRCRGWLLPALADATEDEVLNELLTNRATLWAGSKSAVVTRLETQPEPHVSFWLGGGDLRELVSISPVLLAWGKMQGAVAARICGRPGWARLFRTAGAVRDGEQLRMVL